MRRIDFTTLRDTLASQFDRVESERSERVVTRPGRADLVILPRSELEGLKTTLHLLGSPVNSARLRESIAERDAGLGQEHDLIEP